LLAPATLRCSSESSELAKIAQDSADGILDSAATNVAADPQAPTTVTLKVDDTPAHLQITTPALKSRCR